MENNSLENGHALEVPPHLETELEKKSALKNITPIRKKALLAVAAVVDEHSTFLNHQEVFSAYGLPHDFYKLRQLAEGAGKLKK